MMPTMRSPLRASSPLRPAKTAGCSSMLTGRREDYKTNPSPAPTSTPTGPRSALVGGPDLPPASARRRRVRASATSGSAFWRSGRAARPARLPMPSAAQEEDQDSFAHGRRPALRLSRRAEAGGRGRDPQRVHHLCGDAPEPHPSVAPVPAAATRVLSGASSSAASRRGRRVAHQPNLRARAEAEFRVLASAPGGSSPLSEAHRPRSAGRTLGLRRPPPATAGRRVALGRAPWCPQRDAPRSPAALAASEPSSPKITLSGGHESSPPRSTRTGQSGGAHRFGDSLVRCARDPGPCCRSLQAPPDLPGEVQYLIRSSSLDEVGAGDKSSGVLNPLHSFF